MHGELIEIANAIALRYDAGICRHKYEHPGVVEIYKMDKIHIAGSLENQGWHRLANEVLFDDGIATTVTCQSNNLCKKVLEITKMGNNGCNEIGRMDNSDGSLEIANRVYGDDGCSPCLNAHANDTVPKVLEVNKLGNVYGFDGGSYDGNVYDKEGLCPTMRSCMCHGSVPEVIEKQMVEVKQATKDGYVPCEVGGGMRLELPKQYHTKGQGNRERTDKSNTDDGEYP